MRNLIIALATSTLLSTWPGVAAGQEVAETLTPARVLMERAEELHREHRLDAALTVYREVVRAQDSSSELPVLALERIATIHLAAGRPHQAARAMDELSARAEWLGYPDVQARALIEAAVLHQQTGARHAALERVRRLEPLLASPHLNERMSARIRSRLRPAVSLR